MIKHSFQKKFYYKRDDNKNIIYNLKLKDKLSVDDKIIFLGKLYDDKEHKEELATTEITYKISKKFSDGVIIETVNKYCFNKNNKYGVGEIIFYGKFFSSNFNIKMINKKPIVCLYHIEPSMLLVKKGTKNYKDAFGYAKYSIDKNGIGEIIMIINILDK